MKNIIITALILCFTIQVYGQQKYTDEEIGFDKEKESKTLKADGISKEGLEITLASIRSAYVAVYEMKKPGSKESNSANRETTIGCGNNIGFENGFTNWCYTRFQRALTSGTNPEPDPGPGNDVPITQQGPQVCDDLTGVTEVTVQDALANDPSVPNGLDLSSFDNQVIKLGSYNSNGRFLERVEKTFQVTNENRLFSYRYAVVLQDPNHNDYEQPYFRVFLEDINGNEIICSRFEAVSGLNTSQGDGFIDADSNFIFYKQPAIQTIDLIDQGLIGQTITVVAEIADCTQGAHFGVAYFEAFCSEDYENAINVINFGMVTEGDICLTPNNDISFDPALEYSGTPLWNLYDNNTNTLLATYNEDEPSYTFTNEGNYRIELTVEILSGSNDPNCNITSTFTKVFDVIACPCEDCYSFKPQINKKYVISGWIKEDTPNQVMTYENASIEINYLNNNESIVDSHEFFPSKRIIEGWQRVHEEFIIPVGTVSIEIQLKNVGSTNVYFDDIRIHPYNGNMKSFVYDPITQKLMAELDENNYSTFYEYDQEGGLVRVKKETEKGVYTIQETRSKTSTKY